MAFNLELILLFFLTICLTIWWLWHIKSTHWTDQQMVQWESQRSSVPFCRKKTQNCHTQLGGHWFGWSGSTQEPSRYRSATNWKLLGHSIQSSRFYIVIIWEAAIQNSHLQSQPHGQRKWVKKRTRGTEKHGTNCWALAVLLPVELLHCTE